MVLASHSLTVPSAEQERRRWCALLYTKPQTESVCPHNSPRSIDGSITGKTNKQSQLLCFDLKIRRFKQRTHGAVTIGVVGVDVGIGGVPALYSRVNSSAETLLSCTAHHHTQYSTPVIQIMTNHQKFLSIKPKHFFYFCAEFLPVGPESVDRFHI